ncbi:QA-SNARE, putative [Bodo saltans]|uniref:QA-SNARE, putative n=1 Tax=Bodo saltans TaxID=75058 RepID=A0A0S4IZB3_BODSA|nr:QA-SNARE, putative [Bodo saltans]|eukprot:CUG03087.1 QA-SNARE, putative [Bodo saltans]
MADYEEYNDEPRRPRPVPTKNKKSVGRGGGGGNGGNGGANPSPPAGGRGKAVPRARGGGGEQTMILQQVDLSELTTEEALQDEKRRAAREIEEGVRDIKDCYDEFSTLVTHQQEGIDRATKNVEVSVTNVQNGTEQLKQAGEYQKSSRKRMCCIVGILVVVIAVVVVVIVILKK